METSADELRGKVRAVEEYGWFARDHRADTKVLSTKEKTEKLDLMLIQIKTVCAAEDAIKKVETHTMGETDC